MKKVTSTWVANQSKKANVVMSAKLPVTVKDLVIGGTMVACGIGWITVKAWEKGGRDFDAGYFKALDEIGCVRRE